jgi:hypothetical protein
MALWHRRLIVTAAITALLAAPLGACASELLAPAEAQMACCQAGHHDCGEAMKAADCCTQSDNRSQQINASKVESIQHTAVLVLQPLHPAAASMPDTSGVVPIDAPRAPIDSGPPDCISFSALLI